MPLRDLDKDKLLAALVERLTAEVDDLTRLAQGTAAGATHEEARPDDDKDTRALEQTYLARGQAERVATASRDLQILASVRCRDFHEDRPVAATALVELEDEDEVTRTVFLLPVAGGSKIEAADRTIQVITPSSPLGEAILEKTEGDELELRTGGTARTWTIVAVG